MTDHNHHNRPYTLADIEKYLQGRLTPAEMHALEKAALSDPFLTDAIEGFRLSDMKAATSDLADLQERILQEPQKKRIIPWIRIAAMFILLAGAGTFGWYLLHKNTDPAELVQLNKTIQPLNADLKSSAAQDSVPEKRTPETALSLTPDNRIGDISARAEAQKKPMASKLELSLQQSKTKEQERIEEATAKRETLSALRDNTGLPETVVANQPAVTKVGQLSALTVSGSIHAGILSGVSSATALNSITSLGNLNNLTTTGNITGGPVTNQQADLSEIVVTGYKAASRKESSSRNVQSAKSAAVEEINPENGWPSFNQYLSGKIDSARYRNTGSVFNGTLEAELDLNRRGKVQNVIILSTFNTSLNELIIRSIKEGPVWLLANGKPARGKKKIIMNL